MYFLNLRLQITYFSKRNLFFFQVSIRHEKKCSHAFKNNNNNKSGFWTKWTQLLFSGFVISCPVLTDMRKHFPQS